jgi:hypothetical protein
MRWTCVVFAWLILAAVIVQFFLAGLGVFAGASNFEAHVNFGYTILSVMVIGLLPAFAARLPWRTIGLTALLPVLVVLQSVLITAWHNGLQVVAALHVVNGLAIFSLAGFLALRSHSYLAVEKPLSAEVGRRAL